MSRAKSEVYTIADLDCIMAALECADPDLARAFDLLRVALGIEPQAPREIWSVNRSPKRIEGR